MAVFGFIPHLAKMRVITILLSTAVITASRLQMAFRVRANPDFGPGRGNGQRSDPSENFGLMDQLSGWQTVAKHFPGRFPADAGQVIADVAQSCGGGGLNGIAADRKRGASCVCGCDSVAEARFHTWAKAGLSAVT